MAAAGLAPMLERTPLNARRETALERPKYTVERVALEILPGYTMAGNLYLPAGRRPARPAVLIPQGHWKRGRVEHREDYSTPTFGINLAAQGFVAFAYDMVGYNELDALPHVFGETRREQLWSFSPLGLQLWASIRALDFLAGLKEVDARRIAVTGASGGATQTLLLAAVDDRVAASAPVVMVSNNFQGDDACEMAPGLRIGTDNVEIAAVFAPKPLLLVSASGDWTRNTPEKEFPGVQSIYRLYGRDGQVSFAHIQAGHNYNRRSREAVSEFLFRFLQRRSTPPKSETEIFDAPLEALVFGENPKADAAALADLFKRWRELAVGQLRNLDAAARRTALSAATGLDWPRQVRVLQAGGVKLLERDASGERVPFTWQPGVGGTPLLVVHADGSAAARKDPVVREWLNGMQPVLCLDVYLTGEAALPPAAARRDHLTYHHSDDANRVQDILTGLAFLAQSGDTVRLECPGRANPWCALAAALAPTPVDFEPGEVALRGNDQELERGLFVPGLTRAGGVVSIRQWAYAASQRRQRLMTPAAQ